jgi:hypothetical protein
MRHINYCFRPNDLIVRRNDMAETTQTRFKVGDYIQNVGKKKSAQNQVLEYSNTLDLFKIHDIDATNQKYLTTCVKLLEGSDNDPPPWEYPIKFSMEIFYSKVKYP